MTNVLMLNLAYNVIVKVFSAQLLIMALFVLAPDAKRLIALLLLNRKTEPRQIHPLFLRTKLDTIARIAGVMLATWIVYWGYQAPARQALARLEARNTPLHGIWEAEETAQSGLQTDPGAWRYLVFPWEDTKLAVVIFASNAVVRYDPKIDPLANTIEIKAWPGSSTFSQSLSFEYGRPDNNHLVLRRQVGSGDSVALRFRRVDPSSFPLVNDTHRWAW